MHEQSGHNLVPGPAAKTVVSLSQVLLAPLDAIFKAQVHAARSFLNFVLQVSYPHRPASEEGAPLGGTAAHDPKQGEIYCERFVLPAKPGDTDTTPRVFNIPTLALVPIHPLSVEEASFELKMAVSHIDHHRQIRSSERNKAQGEKRPWFLVDEPISVRGVLAPPDSVKQDGSTAAAIHITVKVKSAPMPAGLNKLLTTMAQSSTLGEGPSNPAVPPAS